MAAALHNKSGISGMTIAVLCEAANVEKNSTILTAWAKYLENPSQSKAAVTGKLSSLCTLVNCGKLLFKTTTTAARREVGCSSSA